MKTTHLALLATTLIVLASPLLGCGSGGTDDSPVQAPEVKLGEYVLNGSGGARSTSELMDLGIQDGSGFAPLPLASGLGPR